MDLPTYFVDLTPFAPILSDGSPHTISLDVLSAESNHSINQNWYVTANLQVSLDDSNKPTTGEITVYEAEPYAQTTITGNVGQDNEVIVTVKASRNIHIEADVRTGSGAETHVVWTQSLAFSNTQTYAQNASVQVRATTKDQAETSEFNIRM